MRRRFTRGAGAAALAALLAVPAAASAQVRTLGRVALPKTVFIPYAELAMDDGRVVVAAGDAEFNEGCQGVTLSVLLRNGAATRKATCLNYFSPAGSYGGSSLAVAGTTLGRVDGTPANSLTTDFFTATPTSQWRSRSEVYGDHGRGPGYGAVVGSGSVLAYTEVTRDSAPTGCDPDTGDVPGCQLLASVSTVIRAWPGMQTIWSGSGAAVPQQMAGSRIALRGYKGEVRVLGTDGRVHADVPGAKADAVAVSGAALVSLRSNRFIDVRNADTGARLRVFRAPTGVLPRIDVAKQHGSSWIVVATSYAIYAYRAADGKRVALAHLGLGHVVDVQVEDGNAAWLVQTGPRSWVVQSAPLPA